MKERMLLIIAEITPYSIKEIEDVYNRVGKSIDETMDVLKYATASGFSIYQVLELKNVGYSIPKS